MSNKKNKNKETKSREADCYAKLKSASLQIRALKRHLRSTERELAGLNKQISTGKLISYEKTKRPEPEVHPEKEPIDFCEKCKLPKIKKVELKTRGGLKEIRTCLNCGYQRVKKINTPSL